MVLRGIKESSAVEVGKTDIVEYNGIPCLVVELTKMQGFGLVGLEGFDEGRIVKEYKTYLDLQLAKLKILVKGKDVMVGKAEPIDVKVPF